MPGPGLGSLCGHPWGCQGEEQLGQKGNGDCIFGFKVPWGPQVQVTQGDGFTHGFRIKKTGEEGKEAHTAGAVSPALEASREEGTSQGKEQHDHVHIQLQEGGRQCT